MTTEQYLRDSLSTLASKFPSVTIKYGFDFIINTHIVELTPQEAYYSNTHLDDAWIPVSLDFMRKFPNDYISFISDDSPLKVEHPEFTFNEKQVEAVDLRLIYNELLNKPLNIAYPKHFETTSPNSLFIVSNKTKFIYKTTPTFRNINVDVNCTYAGIEAAIVYENEIPQAA